MAVPLTIKSTIHAADSEYPDVIEQQMDAEILQMEDEVQIFYQEMENGQTSTVRIIGYEDEMIILRSGPISYQQIYQMDKPTVCQMKVPGGQIEVIVKTHQYWWSSNQITCRFTLEQENHTKLGDYQLELEWEL